MDSHDSTYFALASHTHPYWSLTGNSGTDPATEFLGTTDRVSLVLRVTDVPALRIIPAASGAAYDVPSIVGGYSGNTITDGILGAFIGGGGREGEVNSVTGNLGAVVGGYNNTAGGMSFVGGGTGNSASTIYSFVGGGRDNTASGSTAFVGGGQDNTASGVISFIGGGQGNTASGTASVVAGGTQ